MISKIILRIIINVMVFYDGKQCIVYNADGTKDTYDESQVNVGGTSMSEDFLFDRKKV